MLTRNRQILECIKASAFVAGLSGLLGELAFVLTLPFARLEAGEIQMIQQGLLFLLLLLFAAGILFFLSLVRPIVKELSALGDDMDWGAEALCRWFVTHEDPSLAHFFFEKPLIEKIKEENGCEP